MDILPQPPTRAPIWRRRLFILAALALLTGCTNGDFGEVRSTLVNDDIHDWLSLDNVPGRSAPRSNFALTDDERLLHDLAFPLIQPPYDRQQTFSLLQDNGTIQPDLGAAFDRSAYASHLLSSSYRSPSARYSHLIDDIRNDDTRLPQFFETAARVLDIDRKRRLSLDLIADKSVVERELALRRIRSNALLVSLVRIKLAQRVSGYQFALERLVIMTPSPQAADAEVALNHLKAQIARYRSNTSPTWVREQSLANAR